MISIVLYSEILHGDAERVAAELRAQPKAQVEVRINSPGGSVIEGLGIFNALKPRKPTIYIDGIAASIASVIAMAGARVIAAQNALLMVHDPWAGAEGNSAELRKTADVLDKHRDSMLSAYARTGMSREQLLPLLTAETWMTAEEAIALGFVDEISPALEYAAHARECFASYRNVPETIMNANTQAAAAGTDSQAARTAVLSELQTRNTEIMAAAKPYTGMDGMQDLVIEAMADPKMSIDQFRAKALELVGSKSAPANGGAGRVDFSDRTNHNGSDFVLAAADALVMRAGIAVDKPHPGVRDIRGMSTGEIIRVCVSRGGKSTLGGDKNLIRAAMSTSDFPAILENSLGKALRSGFEVEPSTHKAWTRQVTVPDFKQQKRPILGSAPDLLQVAEGGEYKEGSMDEDAAVPYAVSKYGRIVKLTWESLVNDDLGAFMRITQALGQAAARAESDLVYATYNENSGAGPAMQDSVDLFHADHGNLASSVADLTADALGSARILLRRQTAVGGGVMNLVPRFLLVAPEQEQEAETLLAAAARALSQGSDITLTPAWLAQLELIVEARLSGDAFYVLASADAVDTFERAWLEADNGPVIHEETGFAVDSQAYKVRHVFGGRWLDWRGAVKVPLS